MEVFFSAMLNTKSSQSDADMPLSTAQEAIALKLMMKGTAVGLD